MRIALGIEYNGTNYFGWQSQPNVPTLQNCLETALAKVATHAVRVHCAGRTDEGVHALWQVVHFETATLRSNVAWLFGTNSYLPPDIRVKWMQEVPEHFHARFSAIARTYRYLILSQPTASAIHHNKVTWLPRHLDEPKMQQAAQHLLGEHDFSSFRASSCQAKTTVRNVQSLQVKRDATTQLIVIDIKANAFLHHMVRNIVGVLVQIGLGKKDPYWAKEVLTARNRSAASNTAPACGLYLMHVEYPTEFGLPPLSANR